jgi:MFS family permease
VTRPPGIAHPPIPKTVWALGLVSLLMDTSSEIVHALLPLFMTVELGLSVAMVGLIDGVAEATAALTKLISGYVSDRVGKRKPLILIGYGLAAVTKPFFALATSAWPIFGARFADRIGKGLRGAPRDALITDITPVEIRGRAFGLRQSLDTVGAFAGPLIAIGLMAALANDMRSIFWIATLPALIAVGLIIFGVSEAERPASETASARRVPLRFAELAAMPRLFWVVVSLGFAMTLARFSEAFLILKANSEGLPLMLTPAVLVVMNLVYAAGAYPAGSLSDRMPASRLLAIGLALLIAADLVFAMVGGLTGVLFGLILWGAHMAMTQGLLAKLVADTAPPTLRGSAFGMFNLASGIALLLASVIAGILWDSFGSTATFFAGAAFATVALALASRYPVNALSGRG